MILGFEMRMDSRFKQLCLYITSFYECVVPGKLEWDVDFIQSIFDDRDVAAIHKIPLLHYGSDVRIWYFTKSGVYSVRTGYHFGISLLDVNSHARPGPWSKI